MAEQTYTEAEFKQLLKNLFAEKKRVRQLQRKFQTKLSTAHASDYYSKFKEAYAAKEKECTLLYERLAKVRPVIKKLLSERKDVGQLENTLQKETARFESEKAKFVEKLAESVSQSQRQGEIVKDLHEEISNLRSEASKLKEKLDDALRDLEDKQELEQQLYLLQEEKQKFQEEEETLLEQIKQMQEQLDESDIAPIRQEFDEKFSALNLKFEEAVKGKERLGQENRELLEEKESLKKQLKEKLEAESIWEQEKYKLQSALQTSRLQVEESTAELRQAQQHLAKKVKEATLLRDLSERLKVQHSEQEEIVQKLKAEMDRLQNQLNLQKRHEEKLELMVDEWQEKSRELQDQLQNNRDEILELQKVKKQYDQMSNKFSDLKSFLGKNLEE